MNQKLCFHKVSLGNLAEIYRYTSKFGEGSCQHSAVSMYSLDEKYGDEVCIEGDTLYVHRKNLDDTQFRVYLAPFGEGDLKDAYGRIMEDAHSFQKKVLFYTLTEKQASFLDAAYPGSFSMEKDRDLAEYIYTSVTMAEFPGKVHRRRRTEIRSFWRDYGSRASVSFLTQEDIPAVRDFAEKWLRDNAETHDEEALKREMRCIQRQLDNFQEMGLSGTVIRVDGQVKAFCYGVGLNEEYYDVLIEKGSREIPGIYRVLRQESTKRNVEGYAYINFEEDVGVEGLRKVKESYGPAFLIEKYKVKEK